MGTLLPQAAAAFTPYVGTLLSNAIGGNQYQQAANAGMTDIGNANAGLQGTIDAIKAQQAAGLSLTPEQLAGLSSRTFQDNTRFGQQQNIVQQLASSAIGNNVGNNVMQRAAALNNLDNQARLAQDVLSNSTNLTTNALANLANLGSGALNAASAIR